MPGQDAQGMNVVARMVASQDDAGPARDGQADLAMDGVLRD